MSKRHVIGYLEQIYNFDSIYSTNKRVSANISISLIKNLFILLKYLCEITARTYNQSSYYLIAFLVTTVSPA